MCQEGAGGGGARRGCKRCPAELRYHRGSFNTEPLGELHVWDGVGGRMG